MELRRQANLAMVVYVIDRLPGYLFTDEDWKWLDVCSQYATGELTNASVFAAFRKAEEEHGDKCHVDPFELLIDAEICDCHLNPLGD